MTASKASRRNEPPMQIWLRGHGPARGNNELELAEEGRYLWLTPHCFARHIRHTLTLWPRELPQSEHLQAARTMEAVTFERVPDPECLSAHTSRADIIVPLDRRCVVIMTANDTRVSMPYAIFIKAALDRFAHPATRNLDTHSVDRHGGDGIFRMIWEDVILALKGLPPKSPAISGFPAAPEASVSP